jgi:hypothetical protein
MALPIAFQVPPVSVKDQANPAPDLADFQSDLAI